MKHSIDKNGFHRVGLTNKGKCKTYYIHKLVSEYFIKNNDRRLNYVAFLDGNKDNLIVSNLSFCNRNGLYYFKSLAESNKF